MTDIGFGAEFGNVAHPADVRGAFGDGDGAAGIKQVEGVRGFQNLFVGRQRQLGAHQVLRLLLVGTEGGEQEVGVGVLEIVKSEAKRS